MNDEAKSKQLATWMLGFFKNYRQEGTHGTDNKTHATSINHIQRPQTGIISDFLKINTSIMMTLLREGINTHQV